MSLSLKLSRSLAAVLAALVLAGHAGANEPFKVGYLRVMDDAQVIVAQEGGFYGKRGLDVDLLEFKSGTDLVKAIVGGQVDSGVLGFTNALAWASKGADLKVVGGAQRGYHAVVVRIESGIAGIADLKGRTLASQAQGSTADTVLKGVVLKQAGLIADDVNILGVSPQIAVQSLVGRRVDAAFLFEPQASIAQLVAPVRQIYEIGAVWPFPCMVVIASDGTLEKSKDALWKSLDAQRQAIDLLQKQPAEASKLIAGYFISKSRLRTLNRGELPRETVIAAAIRNQTFSAALTPKDLARMRDIAGILRQQGSLRTRDGKPFEVDSILDLRWQKERKL